MLLIRERSYSTRGYSPVLDELGTELYRIRERVSTPREKVAIEDLSGGEVASVHRRMIELPLTYEVRIGGAKAAKIRQKPFTRSDDGVTIDVPGNDDLRMKGDLAGHEYVIERNGDQVAQIFRRPINIPDTYAVQVIDSVDPLLAIGSVIGLEMLLERIENESNNNDDDEDDDD